MKIIKSKQVAHDVDEAIRFAYKLAQSKARSLGLSLVRTTVRVTSRQSWDRGYSGRAWPWGNRVLLRLAPKLPPHTHRYARYKDMPCFEMAGGQESIVYLAAHEFGHLIGWDGDKCGETSCCKFGYAAVEAWRDRQYESPACLI